MKFSLRDILRLKHEGKIRDFFISGPAVLPEPEKKSKYGNKKVTIDGIVFDSQKEGFRYQHLKLLVEAKIITDLRLQVPYELNTGGSHSLKYIADFVYWMDGVEVVEDVKGKRTEKYIKNRRLM